MISLQSSTNFLRHSYALTSPQVVTTEHHGRRIPAVDRSPSAFMDEKPQLQTRKATLMEVPVFNVLSLHSLLTRRKIEKHVGTKKQHKPIKLSRYWYWDNHAPIATFGDHAFALKQSLARHSGETKVLFSKSLKRLIDSQAAPRHLSSIQFWEQQVKQWLCLAPKKRKELIDKRLTLMTIPSSDPRKKLHGQFGVMAANSISVFSVIAPYAGRYCVSNDVLAERAQHGSNVRRYAVDCSMNGLTIDLCGYGHGNITLCINANTTYVADDPSFPENCCFVTVVYQNWPYVFIVSLTTIKQHEELLIDYGRYYWKGIPKPRSRAQIVSSLSLNNSRTGRNERR